MSVAVTNDGVFVTGEGEGVIILIPCERVRFDPLKREEGGKLRWNKSGSPGVPGRVQRSFDLNLWNDWLPLDFQETPMEITDPDTGSNDAGFYRLVVP